VRRGKIKERPPLSFTLYLSQKQQPILTTDFSFASSARAGRRNALPDIQSSLATGGSPDLALKLEALAVKEDAKMKNEEKDQGQPKKPLDEDK
uniref:cAMP-dependent protein kinase inhibitor beta n=1 Tax=Rattus norvegicus TaxID=10116 RepID=Q8R4R3_RAT